MRFDNELHTCAARSGSRNDLISTLKVSASFIEGLSRPVDWPSVRKALDTEWAGMRAHILNEIRRRTEQDCDNGSI